MRFPETALTVTVLLMLLPGVALGANQASCTFTTFSAPAGYSFAQINGISDDGTVVGQLEDKSSGVFVAFARGANGQFTLYSASGSDYTWFNRRNVPGVNVGSYLDSRVPSHVHGFAQSASGMVEVNYPKATNTWLYGINAAGVVVGNYSKGITTKGFKLDGGKYTLIRYPAAQATSPQAINDNGLVVGSYFDGTIYHGFIWRNGSFTAVDAANARFGTVLTDVNKAETIVGNRLAADHAFGFIYKNGAFANIVYAGAKNATAGGINSSGVISGQIYFSATNMLGYTAVCK